MPTAVVTGATQGLGRHAAAPIPRPPAWSVVLAVRDTERGRDVAGLIGPHADGVDLDLASPAPVCSAAARVAAAHAPLDVLVLDPGRARALWDVSAEVVGLPPYTSAS